MYKSFGNNGKNRLSQPTFR